MADGGVYMKYKINIGWRLLRRRSLKPIPSIPNEIWLEIRTIFMWIRCDHWPCATIDCRISTVHFNGPTKSKNNNIGHAYRFGLRIYMARNFPFRSSKRTTLTFLLIRPNRKGKKTNKTKNNKYERNKHTRSPMVSVSSVSLCSALGETTCIRAAHSNIWIFVSFIYRHCARTVSLCLFVRKCLFTKKFCICRLRQVSENNEWVINMTI